MTTALRTDRYELTMLEAALRSGRAGRDCVFEVFGRRLPGGRRYGVLAGTGRVLDAITAFRFGQAELDWLADERVVDDATLAYLADYRFTGQVEGYREGEVYMPGSPLLTVRGTFAEAVLLETVVLSVLNYDSAVATAAARMVSAAEGHPIAEMGSRRTGEHAAVAAARAAYIAGFSATSNLEAGRTWGIPTMGTAAHAFTLLHDSEEEAFRAQVAALGVGTTLLVDTYDVRQGVETAVRVAGPQLGGVRLDSGDLPTLVRETRAQLDALGATGTRITVTSDLDEHAIAALRGTPVDAFGVGTSVVTGAGAPASGFVYKLVARRDGTGADGGAWKPVAKNSVGKRSVGGAKRAERLLRDGVAVAERVVVDDDGDGIPERDAADAARAEGLTARPLTATLMRDGEPDPQWLGPEGVRAARAHCAAAVGELPAAALRLSPGDPALPLVTA
ncbi:nicotinate phosphoribosyltransferase [Microcella frigidaquae]|uniref:Nicotinate phosphoribosyltransferase n=1 Tax=Microcella frigidaquae TaxID=424758 RepID=A0A840XJS7_9MICO|nr:nicotinate phosphoribosyltransferase [Microcella frigidaquae]